MVFYAYMKNEIDVSTYRYLIVAPTMEVLDEWWRVVSVQYKTPKRLTPDFYTHNTSEFNLAASIETGQVASAFLGKLIFTLLNDRDGRIFNTFCNRYPLTNHINGNTFYIRSKSDPTLFWWWAQSSQSNKSSIIASRDGRSRFKITLKDKSLTQGTVMIKSDAITIAVAQDTDYVVCTLSNGSLAVSKSAGTYSFSDFWGGFVAPGNDLNVNATLNGEDWELVY